MISPGVRQNGAVVGDNRMNPQDGHSKNGRSCGASPAPRLVDTHFSLPGIENAERKRRQSVDVFCRSSNNGPLLVA